MSFNSRINLKYKPPLSSLWLQKLETKPIDIEDHIKLNYDKYLAYPLNIIDEEKYPMKTNKNLLNETKEKKVNVKMSKSKIKKSEKKEKKVIDTDKIISEMKASYRDMIVDNANFVLENKEIFSFKDKRNINMNDKSKLNFQSYKYINDKILPQIIQNGLKYTNRLADLQQRAEYDSDIRKYCKELEEKIDNDIELKLCDNYYELKNQNIQKIFKNKPKDYYEREKEKTGNGLANSKERKSNHDSESKAFRIGKYKNRKPTYNHEKKNVKNSDSKVDVEKIYKDTVENIINAVEEKNIYKYINAYLLDKTSKSYIIYILIHLLLSLELESMSFDEQYQIFFNQMKKAEHNLKKLFHESLKGEKDLEETKKNSIQFNEKVLHGIKEIKEALILRLKKRELS